MSENIGNESLNFCTKENLNSLVISFTESSHQLFISPLIMSISIENMFHFRAQDPSVVVSTD